MSTATRHRYTPVCVDQALDGLEERLPALPAAGLRLQRSIAAQVQTTVQGVVQATQTSAEIITRVTANAAKTFAGTSRWATGRTLGTAATAAEELVPDHEPSRGLSRWTKAELYERAQELDIAGRSSMTKDELLSTVTAAA